MFLFALKWPCLFLIRKKKIYCNKFQKCCIGENPVLRGQWGCLINYIFDIQAIES